MLLESDHTDAVLAFPHRFADSRLTTSSSLSSSIYSNISFYSGFFLLFFFFILHSFFYQFFRHSSFINYLSFSFLPQAHQRFYSKSELQFLQSSIVDRVSPPHPPLPLTSTCQPRPSLLLLYGPTR